MENKPIESLYLFLDSQSCLRLTMAFKICFCSYSLFFFFSLNKGTSLKHRQIDNIHYCLLQSIMRDWKNLL